MTDIIRHLAPQFSLKTKYWSQLKTAEYNTKYLSKTQIPLGWCRVVLQARNQAARNWIQSQHKIYLHQNHNPHGVDLLTESADKLALVFYRHNLLKNITLHWPQLPEEHTPAQFDLSISNISNAKAWFYMLRQVSRMHKAAGQSWSYIYRISRARSKRAGIDIALAKLVREYQPLLAHQLISCEPYSYWRSHKEPNLLSRYKNLTSTVQQRFCLILRAKADQVQLLKTIESVRLQHNTQWQLYIAQLQPPVLPALSAILAADPRLIVLADNSKLPVASNSYSMLLQEGDCLHPQALTAFAGALTETPSASILYCDHDMLNSTGIRVAPQFKPDWNPDLLLSCNYIGPAYMVKGELWQQSCTEARWYLQHHYVMLVQALNQLPVNSHHSSIVHLPKVLYHQAGKNKKQSYNQHTVTQLEQSLAKLAATEGTPLLSVKQSKTDGVFKVRYKIPRPLPLVSLLIPTRDALDITRNCVNSILEKTHYPNYEIIILDNQSQLEETQHWFAQISQHEKVTVLAYDHPFNYSAINNFGVQAARGELIGLVNNDTEVINPTWLTEMVQHALRPQIGCVGAKLYYFDNTIQHAGVILGLWGLAGHSHKNYSRHEKGYQRRLVAVQNLSAVTAACLVMRKSLYQQVNGLDEQNLVVAFNDVDLCLKVQQAGYRNLWTPYAELYHYESKSRGKEDTPEKKARELREILYMQHKWQQQIASDPYYSPNLTRIREDFSIGIE
ncbi:GT2 family glycosyltransferase [Rheinheimera pacifica]|uniref:glycosyltransferase family 2 protein n=1 Tax=Rheinheimera pacifica TaxID=173990 RepID=UPI00285A4C35|nr:glycosyltransferase family 2 protein [Rheinheimera pacifica]MDR6984053.1 GT2 family glycosyltransferase [Rheinheimera pacifica]